ncbi:MAG: flagellar biosynthetic protein FliR [Vulcanimicrobiaceae bacterium]
MLASAGAQLVFARCVGFALRAPGFSHPDVPPPVRAGFAYALSLALARLYGGGVRLAPGAFVPALATELALGAAIGTAASMLYDGAFSGGRALDDYVGIRASVPSANVSADAGFGRLWSLAFATGFFVLGGYRIALFGFADAFRTLPPGALVAPAGLATFAISLPTTLLRAALLVAGPAIALALVAQLALATIGRVVPRLNTFTLAFPIVFALALLATLAALPLVFGAAAQPLFDLRPLHAR